MTSPRTERVRAAMTRYDWDQTGAVIDTQGDDFIVKQFRRENCGIAAKNFAEDLNALSAQIETLRAWREPMEEMIIAGAPRASFRFTTAGTWRAMIDTAIAEMKREQGE